MTGRSAALICECGLPLSSPVGERSWLPGIADADPGRPVIAVVRFGDDPQRRRYVRAATNSGWIEFGTDTTPHTPAIPWTRVGRCAAGGSHPVIEADPLTPGEPARSMPDLDPARPLVWLAGAVSADRHAVRMEDFLACRHVGIYYAVCGERIEANPPYAWGRRRCGLCCRSKTDRDA